jgi:hypothetical protein
LSSSFGAACTGEGISSEALYEVVDRAAARTAGDVCVLAGESECLAPVVVNGKAKELTASRCTPTSLSKPMRATSLIHGATAPLYRTPRYGAAHAKIALVRLQASDGGPAV